MFARRREGVKMKGAQAYWGRQLRIYRAVALGMFCLAIMTCIVLPPAPGSLLLSPDDARNLAIAEIMQREPAKAHSIMAETNWEIRDLTPILLGASVLQYVGKAWTITISYSIVFHPTYTVEIRYTGEKGFSWKGTVDQTGKVSEL